MGCGFCKSAPTPVKEEEKKDDSHHFPNPIKIVAKGVLCVTEETLGVVGKAIGVGVNVAEKAVLTATTCLDFPHLSETCIPGVYSYNGLHNDFENLFTTQIFNELGILKHIIALKGVYGKFKGKERTPEAYQTIWKATAEHLSFNETDFGFLPERFDAKQLKALVSSCPFVTMGLHVEGDWLVFDATKNSKNRLTAMICGCLPDTYATGKLYVSKDFQNLYVMQGNDGVKYTEDHEQFEVKLRTFITTLMYFFELVHACLHVYAYIMLGAATHATTSTDMEDFMGQYQQKILTKYIEVAKLLITDDGKGLVVGGYWPADPKKSLAATTEIFKFIASAKNADEWLRNIYLGGNQELYENKNILPQCRPYIALTQKVANSSCGKCPNKDMKEVNKKLCEYMDRTGGNDADGLFKLTNFSEWVECQTMMGILHGSTTTLSRVIFTQYNRYDGDWGGKIFKPATSDTMATVAGTLLGLEADHEINQGATLKSTKWQDMMNDFQAQTAGIQKDYWGALEPDDVKMLGWLHSVWGPNMVGQTQLTITTYI